MKRARRFAGKENHYPQLGDTDKNNPNQMNKKVRILSPEDHKQGLNQRIFNPTPHVNKSKEHRNHVLARRLDVDIDFNCQSKLKDYNKQACDNIRISNTHFISGNLLPTTHGQCPELSIEVIKELT